MIRVIINGMEMDTFAGTDIAQTKQTNDITSIETKQTNYTNAFDLPKTPKNVAAMQYLSLVGNKSDVPYKKNECYLYDRLTGECFVWKGWAVIKESTDVYKTYVYDGNLDLYKTIENFLLKDLDLSGLSHAKDLETVVASWASPVYRYILADYGGKTSYNPGVPKINIDYLTPSVRVKWLWDKLFEFFGITYSGSTFQTEDFTNLWMTYPKGLEASGGDVLVLESDDYTYEMQVIRRKLFPPPPIILEAAYYAKALTWDEGPAYFDFPGRIHMMVGEPGTYRVDISGKIEVELTGHDHAAVLLGKNTVGILPNNVTPIGSAIAWVKIGEPFSQSFVFDLNAYDKVSIVIKGLPGGLFRLAETTDLTVKFTKVNAVVVDFSDAFIDFSATDFVKEVMSEFGLSLFKDKYKSHYEFLTMDERLQTAEAEDWSDRYQGKISENYIYGSYAQMNVLKHRYNEENANYNDGSVTIENVNLPDQKPLFQSKVYSPEREAVDYFGRSTLVYKTFDQNIKDDGTITYKSLDKRFYFMKSVPYVFASGLKIGSEQLGTEMVVPMAEVESYSKIAYKDIVDTRYGSILNVLNRSMLVKVLMNLSAMDVANVDFRKLYHISRNDINGHFMLNKINSYRPGQKTVTELVRVTPSSHIVTQPRISFGNDIQNLTIQIGDTVNIWLSTTLPNVITDISIANAVKISEYHYTFTPDAAGTINISITVDTNGTEIITNTILLTVNP